MKNVHTAPLEVLSPRSNGPFATEPYEAGWADEALAMIYVREMTGPTVELLLRAQISVDGARWFEPTCPTPRATWNRFGNWLTFARRASSIESKAARWSAAAASSAPATR